MHVRWISPHEFLTLCVQLHASKSHLCMRLWILTGHLFFKWTPSLSCESCLMARAILGGYGNVYAWRVRKRGRWRSVPVWMSSASCPRSSFI